MKNRPAPPPFRRTLFPLAAAAIVAMFVWSGCADDHRGNPADPSGPDLASDLARFSPSNPRIQQVMAIQDIHTAELMESPLIVGTATGLTEKGEPAILVFAQEELVPGMVPSSLDGVPVVVQVTGKLVARKSGGGGVNHRSIQTPPIQLGTSGGWRYDLANGFCCGGTLGSLVQKGGSQYILSNWHVLYSDIVSGGNGRVATAGDPVIQPALIDVGCNAASSQNVATLVASGGSLPSGNVDAGIAQVTSGMVSSTGAILEVGTISATTQAPAIGQAVKKSGRTTGLSRASVTGINGTVTIGYENECAGGAAFNKTFTGQIITSNSRCSFLDGGDSGSLMVQDVSTNPRAVGLLFAGSVTCSRSAIAIANPIGSVLSYFGATMVGN